MELTDAVGDSDMAGLAHIMSAVSAASADEPPGHLLGGHTCFAYMMCAAQGQAAGLAHLMSAVSSGGGNKPVRHLLGGCALSIDRACKPEVFAASLDVVQCTTMHQ
jgi:hypothetical protein